MKCPNCQSDNTKSFPAVHAQGTTTSRSGKREFLTQSKLAERCRPPLSPFHPAALFGLLLGLNPFSLTSERRVWESSWVCLKCDQVYVLSKEPASPHKPEKDDDNRPNWATGKYDGATRVVPVLPPPPPQPKIPRLVPSRSVELAKAQPVTDQDVGVDDSHNKLPEDVRKFRRAVALGMTMDEVRSSVWGNPQHVIKSTTAGLAVEDWTYADARLTFEGQRVVKKVFKK